MSNRQTTGRPKVPLRGKLPPPKPYWRPPEHLGDVEALDPEAGPAWLYTGLIALGAAIEVGRIVRDKAAAAWRA